MKSMFKYILFCTLLLTTTVTYLKVSASTLQFTLGVLPTVRYEVTGLNSLNVSTAEELIDALDDQSIDLIHLNNSIMLPQESLGNQINRNLKINGNHHQIYVTGTNALSPNIEGGSLDGALFNLGTDGSTGVFHLQAIDIAISTSYGTNSLISVHHEAQGTWDVILEDFVQNNQSYGWSTMLDSPLFKQNATNLFIRGNSTVSGVKDATFNISGKIVVDSYGYLNIFNTLDSGIASVYGTVYDMYMGHNSVAVIEASLSVFSVDNLNANSSNISDVRNLDLYQGSSLTLNASELFLAYYSTWLHETDLHEMNVRIDSDATLAVANNRGHSAIVSTSPHPFTIKGNPGATLIVTNHGPYPTIDLGSEASYVSLVSPRDFNIQNTSNSNFFLALAIHGTHTSSPNLILRDTNIAIWQLGSDVFGNPVVPSPFTNATLIGGIDGTLDGSSPEIDNVPGGWHPDNTTRIAYAQGVDISASDMVLLSGMSQQIEHKVFPNASTLSFVSSDTNIVAVDEFGVVMAHSEGVASVTVTGEFPTFVPRSVAITVTVVNDNLILDVPAFTEISVYDVFDYMEGVSALDSLDGDITKYILVEGEVDGTVAGIYTIYYSITNSRQDTFTSRRNVLVNDGTFKHSDGFVINGNSATIYSNFAKVITDDELIQKANINVYDLELNDHIINPDITVIRNDFNHIPGVYSITFDFNPSITIDITVLDSDSIGPPGDTLPDMPDDSLSNLPNTGHVLNKATILVVAVSGIISFFIAIKLNANE